MKRSVDSDGEITKTSCINNMEKTFLSFQQQAIEKTRENIPKVHAFSAGNVGAFIWNIISVKKTEIVPKAMVATIEIKTINNASLTSFSCLCIAEKGMKRVVIDAREYISRESILLPFASQARMKISFSRLF